MLRSALVVLVLLLAPGPCRGQSLDEIDRREAAVIAAWEKTPLTMRRALFVASRPPGYGMYEERGSNRFKRGEPLLAYAEPIGYRWRDLGNGSFEFGFVVDFVIKSPDGTVLGGQERFANLVQKSRLRNREFMVTLTLNIDDAPPGDYVLEYKLRDVTDNANSTSFQLPFTLEARAEAPRKP